MEGKSVFGIVIFLYYLFLGQMDILQQKLSVVSWRIAILHQILQLLLEFYIFIMAILL